MNHRSIAVTHLFAIDHDRPIAETFARTIVSVAEATRNGDRRSGRANRCGFMLGIEWLRNLVMRGKEIGLRHHGMGSSDSRGGEASGISAFRPLAPPPPL